MKLFSKFAFVTVMALAAVACGGGEGDDDDSPKIDGSITLPPDASTAPDAAPMMRCDTTAQTGCPDVNMPKCTVALSAMNVWSNVCKAQTGTVPVDGMSTCVRTPQDGAPGVGNDDCVAGAYCTALGNKDGSFGNADRICRRFCNSSASCQTEDPNFTCFALTDLSPPDGICIDKCTLFAQAGMSGCNAGAWCSPATSIEGEATGFCVKGGTAMVNTNCPPDGSMDECAENTICIINNEDGSRTCRSLCSNTLPNAPACITGFECANPIGGLPLDVGVCLPM